MSAPENILYDHFKSEQSITDRRLKYFIYDLNVNFTTQVKYKTSLIKSISQFLTHDQLNYLLEHKIFKTDQEYFDCCSVLDSEQVKFIFENELVKDNENFVRQLISATNKDYFNIIYLLNNKYQFIINQNIVIIKNKFTEEEREIFCKMNQYYNFYCYGKLEQVEQIENKCSLFTEELNEVKNIFEQLNKINSRIEIIRQFASKNQYLLAEEIKIVKQSESKNKNRFVKEIMRSNNKIEEINSRFEEKVESINKKQKEIEKENKRQMIIMFFIFVFVLIFN